MTEQLDGTETPIVWSRDDIGEYHDGRGNLIQKDRDGWAIMLAGTYRPLPYRGKTLGRAKLKVEEVLRDGNV